VKRLTRPFQKVGTVGLLGTIVLLVALGVLVMNGAHVSADGIGSGGNTSGGGGGHQTTFGWGWRLYDVNGGGPSDGFRNGTPWSAVQNACRGSSLQIAIFTIDDSRHTQMGYDYKQYWYEPSPYGVYIGRYGHYMEWNGGPSYISMATAEDGFNRLDPAIRSGFAFGRDVSWYCYGSMPQWTTTGSSSANRALIKPGEQVTWTHRAWNEGPQSTNKAISGTVIRTNFGSNGTATGSSAGVAKNGTVASNSRTYTATTSDGGKTICERLQWRPSAYNNSGNEESSNACVQVKYAGGVSQQLVIDPADNVVDDGSSVSFKFNATNTAGATAAVNFDGYVWYDDNNNGSLDGGETKIYTKGGSGSLPGSPSTTTVTTYTEQVNLTKGGRICGYWNVSSTNPLIENLDGPESLCVFIGFSPRLQAWGGDIRVGSAPTSSTNVASLMRARASIVNSGGISFSGSWSEYGLFAPRAAIVKTSIEGVASAAGLAENSPAASLNQANWSALTFGNKFSSTYPATQACVYGCFATPSAMGQFPEIEAYLQRYGLVDGGKIKAVSGTYTITGNIDDDGSGRPMIIIADNIAIKGNVTNVDAWLIARDSVNTCTDGGASPMQVGDCDKTLRINGPVIAKTLLARRIGDPIADKKTVGEVVNLRGDAYIWAYKTTHATSSPFKTTEPKNSHLVIKTLA
jgi:hypothetical protein